MLPMQRITRLPLLVDAVLSKLKPNDDEFESWKITLAILNKVNNYFHKTILIQLNKKLYSCF